MLLVPMEQKLSIKLFKLKVFLYAFNFYNSDIIIFSILICLVCYASGLIKIMILKNKKYQIF